MSTIDLAKDSLIHISALLTVGGMFFRSQLILRALLLAGTVASTLFNYVAPVEPLWGAIFWGGVMVAVNGTMIVMLLLDRTMYGLSGDEVRLYRAFGVFTPGEFRSLMKFAAWHRAEGSRMLTAKGGAVEELFYVLDGDIRVAKSDEAFPIETGAFIGEVAFLRDTPASATVFVSPGTRYVSWSTGALSRLLQRKPSMKVALGALLNIDMAGKVAATG